MAVDELIERLRTLIDDRCGDGPSGPNYDPELLEVLNEAADALEAAREDAEAVRTAITTAPKCRLLEVQSLGLDDPDWPVLDWMVKSGKRFRIVDDDAIDQARGKGVQS